MRLISLVTCCVINASLLLYADTACAATKTDKRTAATQKTAKHHGKKSAKLKAGPADIWERVRAGMQIPRPRPVDLPEEILSSLASTQIAKTKSEQNKTKPSPEKTVPRTPTVPEEVTTGIEKASKQLENEFDNTNSEAIEARFAATNLQKNHLSSNSSNKFSTCTESIAGKSARAPKKRIHTKIDFTSGAQAHRTTITSNETLSDDRIDDSVDESVPAAFPIKLATPCQHITENDFSTHVTHKDNTLSSLDTLPSSPTSALALTEQEKAQLIQQATNYERVHSFTLRYAQQTGYLQQVADRARPYLFHIVESLRQYNLPTELALLPIVESSYQPTALSPKSAAGLWQFIPSTGLEYNLKQTEYYDERLDITTSTNAAMRYLGFLKQHFHGDWLLAIAAYNCGPGRVDDAIAQNKSNGLEGDYWSLQLPEETQDYVPRLLALATIFAEPDTYNLKLNRISNEPYFVRVKIDREIDIRNLANKDLHAVAELANLSLEQFTTLNPGFLNAKLSNQSAFNMLMPSANAEQLHQRLNMLAELVTNNEKTTPNIVREVENQPANNWEVPLLPYLSLNINNTPITVITPDNKPTSEKTNTEPKQESFKIHHLDKGETLASIAKQYQVTIDDILVANKFTHTPSLLPGQHLKIPAKSLRRILDIVKS